MAYRSLYKSDHLTDRERKNIILLDVIRRNGFDRLCRVGTGDKAMTFLVKTR